jgi:hypothetical protein
MNPKYYLAALLPVFVCVPAAAQEACHRPGEHPAVIVKRMYERQGYDYLSKFYPHPAWLYLQSEAPRPMMDHPAVIVARREQREALERTRFEQERLAAARKD